MKQLASRALIFTIWSVFVISLLTVGALFSESTWSHNFDMGWLLIALVVSRNVSWFLENGKMRGIDYVTSSWPVLPGFFLDLLADMNRHTFVLHGSFTKLTLFAVFSCALLIFIIMVITLFRFGCGLQHLNAKSMKIYRLTTWLGAIVVTVAVIFRTSIILCNRMVDSMAQLSALQSWLYWASLITYSLLIVKMTLPLLLNGVLAKRVKLESTS